MKYYPPYVYSINEATTRRNMAEYDRRQREIKKKCYELRPDYDKLNLRERHKVWDMAEAM